ncbi:hypothetical protein [Niabella sp.]|uniref:hypothetical protein n=1 Tax=Niabella sp. TaxID=1962976 RepID=UPI00260E2346|nr:hypothetical protein [Niabella sp.]
MNKHLFLFIIGAFMVFTGAAQNCLKLTNAKFVNLDPGSGLSSTSWELDLDYTTSGNKTLELTVYCGNTVILTDCFQVSGTGTKTYTLATCATGLNTLKAVFIPRTGSCGSAQCGNSSVVIGGGPLPVTFESITALKKNNQLQVNFTTASENNSKEYVVEGSSDNVSWTAIGKVDSKAVNGISSEPLDYSLTIGLPVSMAALGLGGLFMLTLVRSRWARVLALLVIVVAAVSCLKDGKSVDVEKGSVGYIRIAQYDKDSNIPAYSKVITVVND